MKLELISFVLCPFVQRALITLDEKGIACPVTYIDLEQPPDWFRDISPFGKVPLLRVDDQVLFESAIICEFLDEIRAPALHPADPLQRALHRGWIEFGSSLLFEQVAVILARDEAGFEEKLEPLGGSLARLANAFSGDRYFTGDDFSLVDAAYAPFFMRFELLRGLDPRFGALLPSVLEPWSKALLARTSVQRSVVDDFPERFRSFFAAKGSYLLAREN